MSNVRDSIALDEVIVAAEQIHGRPDPREDGALIDMLDEGAITPHEYAVRKAALHLAMLAWLESVDG